MTDIVRVEGLVKRYGQTLALDHLDLAVAQGEIFGLLGPNGCGKTTAINCILQLLTYDRGTIELFGEPMAPSRHDLKRRIGVVPQQVAVLDELTVRENVDAFCALYVRDRRRRRQRINPVLYILFILLTSAILAGVAAGLFPSADQACQAMVQLVSTTEPIAAHTAVYNEYYQTYRGLYQSLRQDFARQAELAARADAALSGISHS